MTKIDYNEIAKAIGRVHKSAVQESSPEEVIDGIVSELCAVFAKYNPRFNREVFYGVVYKGKEDKAQWKP